MTRRGRLLALLLLAAFVAPACRREAAPAGARRYPLEGKVVEVDVASRKVTIAHEDIPGFMPAMTMAFAVLEKDAVLLRGVGPGDEITAMLVAPDSRYWLEDLVVVKKGTPDPNATPGPTCCRRAASFSRTSKGMVIAGMKPGMSPWAIVTLRLATSTSTTRPSSGYRCPAGTGASRRHAGEASATSRKNGRRRRLVIGPL